VPVTYELADHVAWITIDRPEARNSLDLDHFAQLRGCWERLAEDDDAWVAVITGTGRDFCTGADLKTYIPEITALAEKIAAGEVDTVNGYRLDDGVKAVLRDVELYKPIVAAVNGTCVAGGMELLGGCDIRVAAADATFGVLEPKRGLFAGGGTTVRLPRQVPFPAAMELLLCADRIPAERALAMGLVNEVVPADRLRATAEAYARRITANAPLAVRKTKESVLRGLAVDLAEAYRIEARLAREVFASEDAKEGPAAFAARRPPRWTGR
jgi:enoyl-CoA hydratase